MAVMAVQAQTWLDYDQALSAWTWLRTSNAAALSTYQPGDSTQRLLADGWVAMSTAQGHLAPLQASPRAWQASAGVRSVFRASDRVVLRGGMDYRNRWGSDAGGSVWLNPDEMPFDITEYTDSTRGRIRWEQYRLQGEVGVKVLKFLDMGASFAYTTASGAKQKDPRHTNSIMRLETSVGTTAHWNRFRLGVNYVLRRFTEAVQFRTYGRTDRIYHYLIDNGAFYGRDEQTDGKGYVSSDNEKPLLDMRHGLALQRGYEQGAWSVVAQWQWLHRHGHYGLESPSQVDFNQHRGDQWQASAWLQHATPSSIYRLELGWQHENVKDYERTYRIITDGGVTDIVYYDNRLMGRRQEIHYHAGATAQGGIRRQLATWQLDADVDHHRRQVTAIMYPYYREQTAHLTTATLRGTRNWITRRDHVWTLACQGLWATGDGEAYRDATYGTPSDGTPKPRQHETYLMRQYEWLTAQRVGVGAALRWSMPVLQQRMRVYVNLSCQLQWGLNVKWLEDNHRHEASIALGTLF